MAEVGELKMRKLLIVFISVALLSFPVSAFAFVYHFPGYMGDLVGGSCSSPTAFFGEQSTPGSVDIETNPITPPSTWQCQQIFMYQPPGPVPPIFQMICFGGYAGFGAPGSFWGPSPCGTW